MKHLQPLSRENRPTVFLFLLFVILLVVAGVQPVLAQEVFKAPPPKPVFFTPLFLERLGVNTISVFILVVLVYLPIHRKKEYFFLFFILNFLVFIIMFMILRTSSFTSFGAAGLGLLAFFSLLRLRTDTISMKDMTYLFVVLTMGLMNAVMTGPYFELITLDATLIALTYGLDKDWLSKSIHMRELQVDSLDNIIPQQTDKLIADLRVRTGLEIQRVHIQSVDLVKKRAVLHIYYY
ncbi:MAG: DUF4956 domain-containing protein [Cyclobacteriaceae bacterium]|nr:DUF4956 domain-containing protein [Cyclobacteriaceae bacterium]